MHSVCEWKISVKYQYIIYRSDSAGKQPRNLYVVYRVHIVTLQLFRLLSLLLPAQLADWVLGSGAAITLVHNGAGGAQSQDPVLLHEEAGGRREKMHRL